MVLTIDKIYEMCKVHCYNVEVGQHLQFSPTLICYNSKIALNVCTCKNRHINETSICATIAYGGTGNPTEERLKKIFAENDFKTIWASDASKQGLTLKDLIDEATEI